MDDWKKITKDSYNKYASDYALHTTGYRGKLQGWIDHFSNQFTKGSVILDLGCGPGRDASYFYKKGFKVVGVDISSELIKIAKNRAPDCKFIVMDFEALDFPEKSFNGVWASASLLHLPRAKILDVFKNIKNLIKKNGSFFLLLRVGSGEKFTVERRGNAALKRFYSYYQPEELRALLKEAGFSKIEYELDVIDSGEWVGIFAN